jgi:hypothetical protein
VPELRGRPGRAGGRSIPGAVFVLALLSQPGGVSAQEALSPPGRPLPAPVVPPASFRAAVEDGTRTNVGRPGPDYWTNYADYTIEATLDPETARLEGHERVRYENRSPDTLSVVGLYLYQNLHAPGVMRNEAQEITGGVELRGVRLDGREVPPLSGPPRFPFYSVNGTIMRVNLDRPLLPGDSLELDITWSVTLPQNGAGRMGYSDHEMYLVGYWFPKVAVYDDLSGWDIEPYMGAAEFYDSYGDYDVTLTVPGGWTVMATGDLRNPSEVYSAQTLDRLAAAAAADTIVNVATVEDRVAGTVVAAPSAAGLTYRFTAERVRDFTWTASSVQRWDATSAEVPDRDGDGVPDRVLIHSLWREDRAPGWAEQALYAKHAIEHHSRFTGFPYPWSHMTSVEGGGVIGGGMEFPMLTLMGTYLGRPPESLYAVTTHELAHMWVPMIVGTNEKLYAWMDEGSTTFLEDQSQPEYWPGSDSEAADRDYYLSMARAGAEQSMMRHGDYYEPGQGYGVASYSKPATLMVALRGFLGEETFLRAYRGFIADWAWGHPTAWDFFNAFEAAVGRDLDWFWTSFYYETWVLDQAVAGVEDGEGGPVVVVEDRGWAPMPAPLRIETTNAGVVEEEIPVEVWLSGQTRAEVQLPASVGTVTRVEIDPEALFPDANRSNNVWSSGR